MANIICSIGLLLVAGMFVTGDVTSFDDFNDESSFDINASLGVFSRNLFESLGIKFSSGFVVSPVSMYTAVSLLSLGAGGNTSLEMWQALAINVTDPTEFCDAMSEMIKSMVDIPTVRLNSKLFINDSAVNADFITIATNTFGFDQQTVDFGDIDTTHDVIHGWVMNAIENASITTSLSSSYFPNALYLASVLSFNAEWKNPFDVDNTTWGTFTTVVGDEVEVEMMNIEEMIPFIVIDSNLYLQLEYSNTNWSFIVMLPNATEGLAESIGQYVDSTHLKRVADALRDKSPSNVKLSLPKFNASFRSQLSDIFSLMGAESMFGSDAEFPMFVDPNHVADSLYFDEFRLNEWGTGTPPTSDLDVQMGRETTTTSAESDDIVEIIVDRSFVYFIVDQHTNFALYMGYMFNPANCTYEGLEDY